MTRHVNVGIKLLEFHQLSWRERFSSFRFSIQFLGSWSRKAPSDQQSNCPKINNLMAVAHFWGLVSACYSSYARLFALCSPPSAHEASSNPPKWATAS